MATASEIVVDAFREGNLVGATTTLTTEQQTEGLKALNNFLDSLYGYELGEFAMDWPVAPRNTAPTQSRFPLFPQDEALTSRQYPFPPANVRVLINITAIQTLYFPQAPSDGARMAFANLASDEVTLTVDGNGRTIGGVFTVAMLPSAWAGKQYFYRADLGDWQSFTGLVATDTPVLPPVYDDLLALGTLARIASRFGRSLTADQVERKRVLMLRLKAQYRQRVSTPVDVSGMFRAPRGDYSHSRLRGGSDLG